MRWKQWYAKKPKSIRIHIPAKLTLPLTITTIPKVRPWPRTGPCAHDHRRQWCSRAQFAVERAGQLPVHAVKKEVRGLRVIIMVG